MKLFVKNKNNPSHKLYLDLIANTRQELRMIIGSNWFILDNQQFHVSEVLAEKSDYNNTTSGALIGGLVGALAGPAGIFFGGIIGGAIGSSSDEDENKKVRSFNNSLV